MLIIGQCRRLELLNFTDISRLLLFFSMLGNKFYQLKIHQNTDFFNNKIAVSVLQSEIRFR